MNLCSAELLLHTTVPWKQIGVEDDKWISAVCDYYTNNPVKARIWKQFSIEGFEWESQHQALPRIELITTPFFETKFTEKDSRLISKVLKGDEKVIVNAIEIPLSHLKDLSGDRVRDEVSVSSSVATLLTSYR